MKLAVLLLSCTGSARVTDFSRERVHSIVGNVAGYFLDQSGGRVSMEFRVFDWFQLPHTSQQWNDLDSARVRLSARLSRKGSTSISRPTTISPW